MIVFERSARCWACLLYTSKAGAYETIDIVIAIIAILLLFEACRRVVGIPILVVVIAFIAYAYFGNYIPGYFGHRGYSLQRIVSHLYLSLIHI